MKDITDTGGKNVSTDTELCQDFKTIWLCYMYAFLSVFVYFMLEVSPLTSFGMKLGFSGGIF